MTAAQAAGSARTSAPTTAALIVMAVLVFALLPYRWARSSRAGDHRAAQAMHAQTAQLDLRVAHARSVSVDRAGWTARARTAKTAFPPTVDVGGELAAVRASAAAAGVHIVSLTADPPATAPPAASTYPPATGALAPSSTSVTGLKEAPPPAPTAQPVTARIQVQGPVTAIETFLGRLRASSRLITVSRADVSIPDDPAAATADLTAQLWTLPT